MARMGTDERVSRGGAEALRVYTKAVGPMTAGNDLSRTPRTEALLESLRRQEKRMSEEWNADDVSAFLRGEIL